ncbi:MAG: glycosyltransferase [Vicinamibacteraceae bacterium]|nr:glycosyltransferase [Vicinamibacteraceae bacterium]
MTAPFISVLLPTRNGGRHLADALDSVAGQPRLADLEVLLVDGGSTDDTLAVADRYTSRLPLTILEGPATGTWAASANVALRAARGEYISLMHQDDEWLPQRVTSLRDVIERADGPACFLATPAIFSDRHGRPRGTWRLPFAQRPIIPSRDAVRALLVQNFLALAAPLVTRESVVAAGGLDESLAFTADWKLWLTVAARHDLLVDRRPLVQFRVHGTWPPRRGASARRLYREELERVVSAFVPLLDLEVGEDARWLRAARLSMEMNVALARLLQGRWPVGPALARAILPAGPRTWARYIRYSRILDRARARLGAGRR